MINLSKKYLIAYLIALVVSVFAATDIFLLLYVVPTEVLRNFIIIALCAGIVIIMFLSKTRVNGLFWFVLLLLIVFFNNNYLVKSADVMVVGLYISMVLLCVVSLKNIKWAEFTLRILKYIYMFYALCTIIFFFTPGFYKGTVVKLFSGSSYRLISLYNDGCMAGLTSHYSTNAMFIATGLIIGIASLFYRRRYKRYDIIYTVIMAVALLLTGKRAHIIFAASSAFITYYYYSINNKRTRIVKLLGVLIVSVCTAGILFAVVPALGNFILRFQTTISAGDVTQNRTVFWELAYNLFKRHKILGIGWCQFQTYSTGILEYTAHVHNTYLQLLCETGIIGFLIYVAWFVYNYVNTVRIYKRIRLANINDRIMLFMMSFSLCFQTFFLLYCCTGNPLYDREMFIPYFISCAVQIYYSARLKSGALIK